MRGAGGKEKGMPGREQCLSGRQLQTEVRQEPHFVGRCSERSKGPLNESLNLSKAITSKELVCRARRQSQQSCIKPSGYITTVNIGPGRFSKTLESYGWGKIASPSLHRTERPLQPPRHHRCTSYPIVSPESHPGYHKFWTPINRRAMATSTSVTKIRRLMSLTLQNLYWQTPIFQAAAHPLSL